jgi:hypothetical protein
MGKELDLRLRDEDVLSEIEMTSNLMIAASEHDGPLTQRRWTRSSGCDPRRDAAHRGVGLR